LCPTDLTPKSEAALRYATTLARAYEAQLILMYCQANSPDQSDKTVSGTAEMLAATLRKHATAAELNRWHWQSKVVNCDDPTDCMFCRRSVLTSLKFRGIRWAAKASITKPPGVCKGPCLTRRTCGARSKTSSVKDNLIARSFTMPNETKSIWSASARKAPALE